MRAEPVARELARTVATMPEKQPQPSTRRERQGGQAQVMIHGDVHGGARG